jgi:effector-binding domain-containing protein
MRQNPQFKDLSFREIREAMRADDPVDYGVYLKVIPSWHRSSNPRGWYPCISYEDYKYIRKQQKKFKSSYNDEDHAFNELVNVYNDYIRMLYRSDHNTKDEYWRYPSDIQAFHDRLTEEERIKGEARRIAEAKAEAKRLRAKQAAFKRIVKKFASINGSIDGYSIFVTSDYDEWQRQADVLHQCICASGYYQGTADGNYTIVFIQKEGVPVATAQIFQDGKIGQFYADEIDRSNCAPSEEVRAAFNKWLESVPKSKFKKSKPRQRKSVKKEVAA